MSKTSSNFQTQAGKQPDQLTSLSHQIYDEVDVVSVNASGRQIRRQ
jgi:hypothetical protein